MFCFKEREKYIIFLNLRSKFYIRIEFKVGEFLVDLLVVEVVLGYGRR